MSLTVAHPQFAPLSWRDLDTNETIDYHYPTFSLPETARFWLLLLFEVPSLSCSLLIIILFFNGRLIRKQLHNHVIIALLIVGLFAQIIDIPFYLNYLRTDYVSPASSITCILWWFAATGISNITNLLMAWASIERHILVFHDRLFMSKQGRFVIHYLPLFSILFYGFTYYIVILVVYQCENLTAFDQDWCSYPCFYNNEQLAMYDTIVNSIIPTPIIVFFCGFLLIRVIQRKRFHRQRFRWRRYRVMLIQLFSISILFLLFNLPMTCLLLTHVLGLPSTTDGQFEYYTYFLYHYISLLMPFVCLLSLPDIRKKIRRRIAFGYVSNTVGPGTAT